MRLTIICLILISLLIISTQGFSEVNPQLPEIVVTATRIQEPEEEVTQDVIVITEEEIRDRGVDFITDVLRGISDLNLVQNGGAGHNATVFLRGGSPNQVVVMIDGVKVKSTTTGSFDLSGLRVEDIERIEIVLGPQSTMYGSEAMAGVINIITKRGKGRPSLNLVTETGSFGTGSLSVALSGERSPFDYRLSVSYLDTEGFSAASSGTEDDGYENTSFSLKLGARPTDRSRIEMNLRYYRETSELDSYEFGTGLVDDLNYIQRGEHYLISGRGQVFFTPEYEQILTASLLRDYLDFTDPDTEWNNATVDSRMKTIDWQHNIYIGNYTITAGGEYRQEEAYSKGNFDESVDNRALYLNARASMMDGDLILTAGTRYDDHELAGSKITYRAGVLYRLPLWGLRLRASYGTGFRAPTLNELFFPFFGNPDLKPEKSRGFDLELEGALFDKRVTVGVSYFNQKYRDLIDYDFTTYTAQNIGKAEVKGFRVSSHLRPLSGLEVALTYTNLDAYDRQTGQPLTRRPHHKVVLRSVYEHGRATAGAEYIYVSGRFDSASDRNLRPYNIVNLFGQYRLTRNLALFYRAQNIFNVNYEEAGGYNAEGASLYGGLRAEF